MSDLRQLRRLQWGVRAALALGVAASVAANVMHARADLSARVISAWAPIALLVVIELISRVPVHRTWLAVSRHGAAVLVAAVAAWASYWHMAAVAARYGEETVTAHLLPVSVDMLIVVASICLLEVGGRIRAEMAVIPPPPFDVPVATTSPVIATVDDVADEPAEVAASVDISPEKIATRRRRRQARPKRGTGRVEVAKALSAIPAGDGRSRRQLADEIAAATGLTAPTVRKYLGEIATEPAEAVAS